MIKTLPSVDEAKQTALQALNDAYGRTQTTPEGLYCRIGRIDRAYRILAQKGADNSPIAIKAKSMIASMEEDADKVFAQADKALASYIRSRKFGGLPNDIDAPICDCAYCSQPAPTINGVRL